MDAKELGVGKKRKRIAAANEVDSTHAGDMKTYIALFRALNIGGNRISMDDLKALLATNGARRVATYVQSGNAVFELPADRPLDDFCTSVVAALDCAFGADKGDPSPFAFGAVGQKTAVTVRSLADMRAVVDAFPFAAEAAACGGTEAEREKGLSRFHCMFFNDAVVDDAGLARFPKEKLNAETEQLQAGPPMAAGTLKSKEVLLRLGSGVAGSKVTTKSVCAALNVDVKLYEPTMRNWRTVLNCAAMLEDLCKKK